MIWLSTSEKRTGIPYERKDDGTSHSYVDLRAFPDQVAALPEVVDDPGFAEFLGIVNGPASIFRTVGCGSTTSTSDHSEFPCRHVGFVGMAFELWEWNLDRKNFEDLFLRFSDSAEPEFWTTVSIEFEMSHAFYLEHGADSGWLVTIWIYAHGATMEESRRKWVDAWRVLQEFMMRDSLQHLPAGTRNHETLSAGSLRRLNPPARSIPAGD